MAQRLKNLPFMSQGKTRDLYGIPQHLNHFLIFASNRLSTHNVVHLSQIPNKGEVLTAMVVFWCRTLLDVHGIFHHLVAHGKKIYDYLPGNPGDYPDDFHLRAIVVHRLDIIPVEFIYRRYLAKSGSLYRDYYGQGLSDPYGLDLPPGLPVMHRFDKPVFTPTEKSKTDDPLPYRQVEADYPAACELTYRSGTLIADYLAERGITDIDTKNEAGFDSLGRLCLADEFGTPDCSRWALTSEVHEGADPPWLDKQLARDLAELRWKGGKKEPIRFGYNTELQLSYKYLEAFEMVTGQGLSDFQTDWFK